AASGSTWKSVDAVQDAPSSRSRPASMRGRQCTAAVSGRTATNLKGPGPLSSAAGDRAAEDDEVGVDGQRGDLLGAALAMGDDRVVAVGEPLPERGDGALDRGGVGRCPLRQGRVAGLVHADEACHAFKTTPVKKPCGGPMIETMRRFLTREALVWT